MFKEGSLNENNEELPFLVVLSLLSVLASASVSSSSRADFRCCLHRGPNVYVLPVQSDRSLRSEWDTNQCSRERSGLKCVQRLRNIRQGRCERLARSEC